MNQEKFNKELKEIKENPEQYLKSRKIKVDLRWFLVSLAVSFVIGAIIF